VEPTKTKPKRPATGAKTGARTLAYPVEIRLRIVRLFLEEGYSARLLREEFGVSSHSVQRWVKAYRNLGVGGLEPKRPLGGKRRVADEVRQQAVEVKRQKCCKNPSADIASQAGDRAAFLESRILCQHGRIG
jgi:transposase